MTRVLSDEDDDVALPGAVTCMLPMAFGRLAETRHIHEYLIHLNELGFYTFSSQPWSSKETPRGARVEQLEYVAGLIDPLALAYVGMRIDVLCPTIRFTTPSRPRALSPYRLTPAHRFVHNGRVGSAEVVRPWIGIRYQAINEDLAAEYRLPVTRGLFIAQVHEGTPAARAGLRDGDIITAAAGRPMVTADDLRLVLRRRKPGDQLAFKGLRGGEPLALTVTLGEMPAELP